MKLYQILKLFRYSDIQIENIGFSHYYPIKKPSSLFWEDYQKNKENLLFKSEVDYIEPIDYQTVRVWLKVNHNGKTNKVSRSSR